MTCIVRTGDVIDPRKLLALLLSAGYERTEVCEGPGQVCLRGGYLDVFPITAENPVRIHVDRSAGGRLSIFFLPVMDEPDAEAAD